MSTRIRQGIVTLLVVYPTINALLMILNPLLAGWPMPVRTFFVSLLMVSILVGWAMPIANQKFSKFINQKK